MIIHDHHDGLLTETVTVTDTVAESGIIDICEPGGSEAGQIVITAAASETELTLTLKSATTSDGEFEGVEGWSFQTTGGSSFERRERVPMGCGQYIKLEVSAGSAPAEPVEVTLRYAV